MAPSLKILYFILLAMENFIGMVANGFIVLVNFMDWFRSRKLTMTDLILTCLGFSRLLFEAVLILHVSKLCFSLTDNVVLFSGSWKFTNTVNLWFATWLSVLYLVKIAIFSHPVFLQAKQGFPRLVPQLLLGSVVFSAFITIFDITGLSVCSSPLNNTSDSEMKMPPFCKGYFSEMIPAVDFIPFIVFLSAIVLLITSLWKHTRRLQHSGTSTRDLNTQVHLTAIKALVSFAFLYLSFFLVTTPESIVKWASGHFIWEAMQFFVSALYPSGHAIILILINPKLKQAWLRMIRHLKCFESKHLSQAPS